MNKTEEAIQEKGSITKWMYVKESRWLPVIYTPFQDINAFCSVYCKCKEGIPLIINQMMHKLEEEILASKENKWADLSEREKLEVQIQAGRQAQKNWNFFWESAMEVNSFGKFPFIIRMRHWKDKNKK